MDTKEKLIADICLILSHQRSFWASGGWAPAEGAHVLARSSLHRHESLAHALKLWLVGSADEKADEGMRILAWASLGAQVEGSMMLFLAVHANDYGRTPMHTRRGDELDPDELLLAQLCKFFDDHVWTDGQEIRFSGWLHEVRGRRNAIHSCNGRPLGTWDEFWEDVRIYRAFLLTLEAQIPYPQEQFAYPAAIREMMMEDA